MELDTEELLQGDQALEDAEGMEEVFASLTSMKNEVELMRRPLGTFESPARTCKELMMVQPDYTDGQQSFIKNLYHATLYYFTSMIMLHVVTIVT